MLKIGDFSKLSRISIRMLRFYDENEVLKPARIDENGYRYYDSKQLYWAYQIKFLKEIGFGTAGIKEVLEHYHDSDDLKRFFQARLCDLKEEKKELDNKISRLEKADELLKKEDMLMKYVVELKEVPGVDVIALRGIIPSYEREDLLWKGLCSEIEERQLLNLGFSNEGARAYFFDEGYKESDVDMEICQVVRKKGTDTDRLKFKHLPIQTCACVTFKGGYHQISEVSSSIGKWINEQGYKLDGANFCIYHIGYGTCKHEDEFVTEVCYPICK